MILQKLNLFNKISCLKPKKFNVNYNFINEKKIKIKIYFSIVLNNKIQINNIILNLFKEHNY